LPVGDEVCDGDPVGVKGDIREAIVGRSLPPLGFGMKDAKKI